VNLVDAAPIANDVVQSADVILDPTPFFNVMSPAAQKALSTYVELRDKNSHDLKELSTVLAKHAVSPQAVIQVIASDKQILSELQNQLTHAGGQWHDNYPLYSCLAKFLGTAEETGIYDDAVQLLTKHPEILKGDLSAFGPKGPQAREITLIKTLMLYGVIVAYNCANLTRLEDICKVQILYPTPLFPETTKTIYDDETKQNLWQLVSKVRLSSHDPVLKEPVVMFPNAGYVFGGNLFAAATPWRAQPMGDCASLMGYIYGFEVPNHPRWRFSTRYCEQVCRWHTDNIVPDLTDEYDAAVLPQMYKHYIPVAVQDLQQGDLIIWRPVTITDEAMSTKVGHMALFLAFGSAPNRVIILDLKRESDGKIEGITIREVNLHRPGLYDEEHKFKTFILRRKFNR
jgi:hypothetical protein